MKLSWCALVASCIAVPRHHRNPLHSHLVTPEVKEINDNQTPYFPSTKFIHGLQINIGSGTHEEVVKAATQAMAEKLGLKVEDLKVTDSYRDKDGIDHVLAFRTLNGVPIINSNIAFHAKNGRLIVMDFADVKTEGSEIRESPISHAHAAITVTLEQATQIASKRYHAPLDKEFKPELVYIQKKNGQIASAHLIQLRDDQKHIWCRVALDVTNGEILEYVNYVNTFNYQAIELPNDNPKNGFKFIVNPERKPASPFGWVTNKQTDGNNARIVHNDKPLGFDHQFGFSYRWQSNLPPNNVANVKASMVNAFYVVNRMHDISYAFGFDEANGNFQNQNGKADGKPGDAVNVIVQDSTGVNNANFATPPDGQKPRMRLYLFNNPVNVDSAMANDVIIHEYGHGISNRLTGGSHQGNCLMTLESGGMGEGWSDAFAFMLERKATDKPNTNFVMGSYVTGGRGIRSHPYSTNLQTNPLKYSTLSKLNQVHAIGTVWATMLYELFTELIVKYGFNGNWDNPNLTSGNTIALRLMMGGLKLQPCNPTLLQARDAIIKADAATFGGRYHCIIWLAFAKRGMGVKAVRNGNVYTDDGTVPVRCIVPRLPKGIKKHF
ncbi:Fungalysin metallopeptidase-domain-containing protein, partial [Globomyces pollinis-pini]